MGRLFAIDYGRVRIGLACTDENKIIATPYMTLETKRLMHATVDALLKEVAKKGEAEKFILGLPLHMSGKESPMSEEIRKFGELLEEMSGKEVIYFDERLTSSLVENLLKEGGLSRKERTKHTDQLSATVLLRCYLDSINL